MLRRSDELFTYKIVNFLNILHALVEKYRVFENYGIF